MKKQSPHNEFLEYIREMLEPFGISKIRAMFGGFGIYKNGIMFALIEDHELYFKALDRNHFRMKLRAERSSCHIGGFCLKF